MNAFDFLKRQVYLLPFVALLLILLSVNAFGGPETLSPLLIAMPSPTPTATPKPESTTIRVVGRRGSETDGLRQVISQWEAVSGNTVELVELPFDYLLQRIFTDMWSEAGEFDVIIIDDPWFPALADGGYLTPLSLFEYKPDPDFVPRSLQVCMWPPPIGPRLPSASKQDAPELYALPLVGNVQVMWYRKDIITQPPTDIATLLTDMQNATDPAQNIYGYAYRGGGGNALVAEFSAWNWAYGGAIFDENWEVVINQPASLRALEDFLLAASLAEPSASTYATADVVDSVLQGRTVSALVWPTDNKQVMESDLAEAIDIIPFPRGETSTSQLGNWLLAIPTSSNNKQVAFDFITWATSPDVMRSMTRAGMPPTRTSVFNDPQLVQEFWWLPQIESALRNATWRPRIPEWQKVVNIMSDYLTAALQEEMDPQTALDGMEQDIRQVIIEAGYLQN